jgi:hypothetical protein
MTIAVGEMLVKKKGSKQENKKKILFSCALSYHSHLGVILG